MNPPLTQRIPRQIVEPSRIDGNACEIDNRSEFFSKVIHKNGVAEALHSEIYRNGDELESGAALESLSNGKRRRMSLIGRKNAVGAVGTQIGRSIERNFQRIRQIWEGELG